MPSTDDGRPAMTFVALGDSFTEGLHDHAGPAGRPRGWADRVATALAVREGRIRYANLAIRGRLLDEVVADQVPAAERARPDLVSFHAGPNDVLRPRVDVGGVLRRYDEAVARLVTAADRVVLFTVIARSGGTGRFADGLARRFATFNDGVRATARRHGADLVDVGSIDALEDRRVWDEDRIHLNPQGHRRVAAAVLEALGVTDPGLLGGEPGWWREPLPPPPSARPLARVRAEARWIRRHLLPWVGRRLRGVSSGDGLAPKVPVPTELRGEHAG